MAVIVRPKDLFLWIFHLQILGPANSIPLDWLKLTDPRGWSSKHVRLVKKRNWSNEEQTGQTQTESLSHHFCRLFKFCHPFLGFCHFHVGLAPLFLASMKIMFNGTRESSTHVSSMKKRVRIVGILTPGGRFEKQCLFGDNGPMISSLFRSGLQKGQKGPYDSPEIAETNFLFLTWSHPIFAGELALVSSNTGEWDGK